ncbi:hypothetical protein L228DRAFT_240417 [Xylona heveae TC161]|uniref:Uncharacterized protein n=1 Tax=Xylona heveae (strain CBS 132557 / TC161) TaxID=1328760 RepID=A0A165AKM7_XYLHT|nr:hypothetical protein L228DRAFT_240417 [Xylona heveae TC161]KZF20642.1 hypothetical protein L228DRAFT_240417 [Xylona heveae TC161]
MSEFIGYVGTLHDINSDKSTVALENVVSFGTEGRRSNPEDEVGPSDTVYDYIVFRGSDVKDLRIEEPPKENKPPPVPNDPAILGSGSRPSPAPQHPIQPQQERQTQPPPFQQQPPFPYYYPPLPGQRFGPGAPQAGFPPGPGFPGMPYGAPPGWYPPPGQGFPQAPGPFPPGQGPVGPQGQRPLPETQPQPQAQGSQSSPEQPSQAPAGSTGLSNDVKALQDQSSSAQAKPSISDVARGVTSTGPPPPLESKPDVATALASPNAANKHLAASSKPTSDAFRNGRIVPAVPLQAGAAKGPSSGGPASVSPYNVLPQPGPGAEAALAHGHSQPSSGMKQVASDVPVPVTSYNVLPQPLAKPGHPTSNAALEYQNATKAATAAVAAAMAKLPPAPGQKQPQPTDGAVDNLTRRVQEMRTSDAARNQRQANFGVSHRGGARGGRHHGPHGHKIEVPTTDYDFASANAKFNKQDLVKEAIATGSPSGTPGESTHANGVGEDPFEHAAPSAESTSASTVSYNRTSSFFDNISSESRDREEASGKRLGGREWRGEEMKKNMETFGQGSVDSGYRGGYRGRGRGRGTGRGRGGFQSYRGNRGNQRGGRVNPAAINTTVAADF